MADTPTTSSTGTSTNLDKLLSVATQVYSGINSAQIAKDNAKAAASNAKVQTAVTQQSQSNVMKYVIIGGAALVAVGLLVFLAKRK